MRPIITFVFNKSWLQEDIATLKQLIVEKISKLTEVEHVIGADRETVRLAHHQQIFILNFECYSESCWLEAESENDEEYQQWDEFYQSKFVEELIQTAVLYNEFCRFFYIHCCH